MNKKAIKIDLSTFFDDERRMTCVLVDPNWKSVECLQKRVEFLFEVDSVRFLSDGYFLPPQESIEIIKFCNDLKAFVPKESLERRKKKKSKKCRSIEKSSSADESVDGEKILLAKADQKQQQQQQHIADDELEMKRKYNSLASNSTLANKAKRSKNNYYTLSEITSTSEQVPEPQITLEDDKKSKKSKSKKSKVAAMITSVYAGEAVVENELRETNSVLKVADNSSNVEGNTWDHNSSGNRNKKRLTSTPKDKITSEVEENSEEQTFNDATKATAARPSSIPSSTFLNESKMLEHNLHSRTTSPNPNNPFKKPKISKAHIYYNDSGEIVHTNAVKSSKLTKKEPKTIVIFRCPLNDVTNDRQPPPKPRIFHLKSKNAKKQIVEIQQEIILSPPKILNITDNVLCAKEKTVLDESEKHQEETEKSKIIENSLNETETLNNTSDATASTTIAKSVDEEQSVDDGLEVSRNESINLTQSQNESQMQQTKANETSIMSVDCVDLSIDLDDDDNVTHKTKTTPQKLKINTAEKHDLTADDDLSSDVEEISEIIDLNETEDNCDNTVNISRVPNNAIDDIKIDKILPFSTDLTDLPNIGDILIFKIPYTNKKQQCVPTNYLAGKVEYINRRTKGIKLFIIDGNTELCHVPNQFLCNLDDSQDCIKYVQLKLNEMLEPKLFSMA